MATKGQTITNPVSGERITFLETAADTDGELLAIDLELSPDGHVPGMHRHPSQEERFEVLEGRMVFRLGMRRVVAEAGDVVTVPPGAVHKFANGSDAPARARVEIRPALDMEGLLETSVALARAGRTNRKGMPKPVELALFTRAYEAEVAAPFPPPAVVRALMAPLRWYGQRRGREVPSVARPALGVA